MTDPILVVNTEFKNDSQLSGFQVNANLSGQINLTVIIFLQGFILDYCFK